MMPRRRSAETMERDHRAYDLFRRGLSYRQISAEMDWKSPNAAFEAVRRAARDNAMDPVDADTERQVYYDRWQDYRRTAQRVLAMRHYQANQAGNLVSGPDGQPLTDTAPWLAALDRLVKIDDIEIRLKGLNPPSKARVEVITEDVVDAEMKMIAEQIARNDAEASAAAPRPA